MCAVQVQAATEPSTAAGSSSRAEAPTSRQSSTSTADVVTVNVGGKLFTTTRSTLCHFEGSRLEAMFSGRWDASMPRDSAGNPFIDRDPEFFGVILNMLRDFDAAGGYFASQAQEEAAVAASLHGVASGPSSSVASGSHPLAVPETSFETVDPIGSTGAPTPAGAGSGAGAPDGAGAGSDRGPRQHHHHHHLHDSSGLGFGEEEGTSVTIDVPPEERGRFVRELDWYHLTEHVYGSPFPSSNVLSRDARLQLFHMFDETAHAGEQWELLYQASTHGLTPAAFHGRCDDAGPTVVLVRTELDCVFGGYYDGSWSPARHTNLAKSRSFLFIFETLRGSCAHKLRVDADPAGKPLVSQDPGFGPLFGVYVPQKRSPSRGAHEAGDRRAGHRRDASGEWQQQHAAGGGETGPAAAGVQPGPAGFRGGGAGGIGRDRQRGDAEQGILAGGGDEDEEPMQIKNAICAIHSVNPRIGFATLGTPGCPYESPPGWIDCRHITGTASGQFTIQEIEVFAVRGTLERKAQERASSS